MDPNQKKKKTRNRSRTSHKFNEEMMKRAVLKVAEEGASVATVCKEVGLTKKTLQNYVDKYLSTAPDKKSEFIFRPNFEINQVFTNELENVFEKYLLKEYEILQKISRNSIRRSAFEFALICNVHVPKTWNVCRRAGLDWMYAFLNRHPAIKSKVVYNKKRKKVTADRVSDSVAFNKKRKVTADRVSDFIHVSNEDLVEEMEEEIITPEDLDISDVNFVELPVAASHVNESSVDICDRLSKSDSDLSSRFHEACNNHTSPVNDASRMLANQDSDSNSHSESEAAAKRVLAFSSVKIKTAVDEFVDNLLDAYRAVSDNGYVSSERVYNMDEISLAVEKAADAAPTVITACCFIAANGTSLPPFMVFPRRKFKESLLDGYGPRVCGTAVASGRANERVFVDALQHFRDVTRASSRRPTVLLVDDDEHHVTVASIDFCASNGIQLVTVPPHCAGRLQPIGGLVFPTLKSYFNDACSKYRASRPRAHVSMYHASALFNAIYPFAFTEENVCRGFDACGVYPLDEDKIAAIDAVASLKFEDDVLPARSLEHDVELVPSSIRDSGDDETEDDTETDDGADDDVNDADADGAERTPDDGAHLISSYDHKLAGSLEKAPFARYFDDLTLGYDVLERNGGIGSDRVFNMDECELRVRASDDTDADLRLVACCAVNAAGEFVPPVLVLPAEATVDGGSWRSGIEGARSVVAERFVGEDAERRWQRRQFVTTLNHFAEHVRSTRDQRVMLIADDFGGRVSVESKDFCCERGIVLVTVPSYTLPQQRQRVALQPLERKLFRRLTSDFAAECNRWVESKGGGKMTVTDMVTLFENVYLRTFTVDAIVASFDDTGIWPLNEAKILPDSSSLDR